MSLSKRSPLSSSSVVALVLALSLSAAVPMLANPDPVQAKPTKARTVLIQNVNYDSFTGTGDRTMTFTGVGEGTLASTDIPRLDGGTVEIRQAFQLNRVGTWTRPQADEVIVRFKGRTVGEIRLSLQDGNDLLLGFKGKVRAFAIWDSSDSVLDSAVVVDAVLANGKELTLELTGQFDRTARRFISLSGEGAMLLKLLVP